MRNCDFVVATVVIIRDVIIIIIIIIIVIIIIIIFIFIIISATATHASRLLRGEQLEEINTASASVRLSLCRVKKLPQHQVVQHA